MKRPLRPKSPTRPEGSVSEASGSKIHAMNQDSTVKYHWEASNSASDPLSAEREPNLKNKETTCTRPHLLGLRCRWLVIKVILGLQMAQVDNIYQL